MRKWIYVVVCSFALLWACGDSGDGHSEVERDAGGDVQQCSSCTPRCDGNVRVNCDSDGCEVRTDCNSRSCVAGDDGPACVQSASCEGVADACSEPGSQCVDGDIETCAPNEDGCLVLSSTSCDAGQSCDDSSGTAGCAGCTDAPECDGLSESCSGSVFESCADTDDDGCLEYQPERCAMDRCSSSGCTAQGGGDTCGDPVVLPRAAYQFWGEDFAGEYTSTLVPSAAGCVGGYSGPEIIFEVELQQGDVFEADSWSEVGSLSMTMLDACSHSAACLARSTVRGLEFTAPSQGTYYMAAFGNPDVDYGNYRIRTRVNPACGNGQLDQERCDDGNTADGDGCSATCSLEWPYTCDFEYVPGRCEIRDLGSFAAGEAIPSVGPGLVSSTQLHRYKINFSDDVHLSIDATALGFTGIAYRVYTLAEEIVFDSGDIVASTPDALFLEAGDYVVEVLGEGRPLTNYNVDLSTKAVECGDGYIGAGEQCDDGNSTDDDGCTSCAIDAGYTCSLEPSECIEPLTGDNCSVPYVIDASVSLQFDLSQYSAMYDEYIGPSNCQSGREALGREMVFQVNLQPYAVLRDVRVSAAGFTPKFGVIDDCADPTQSCRKYSPYDYPFLDVAFDTPKSTFIVVEPWRTDVGMEGPFTIEFDIDESICGDGDRDGTANGVEGCDDGNTVSGDGCEADCSVAAGWDCFGEPSYCFLEGQSDNCTNPPRITEGSYRLSLNGTQSDDDGYTCPGSSVGFGTSGEDQVFELVVPQDHVALIRATDPGTSNFNPQAILLETCGDPLTCLAQENYEDPTYSGLYYTNTSGADETLYLAVDSQFNNWDPLYSLGAYDLNVELRLPACGDGLLDTGEACDDGNNSSGDGCASCAVEADWICARPLGILSDADECARDEVSAAQTTSSVVPEGSTFTDTLSVNPSCVIDHIVVRQDFDTLYIDDRIDLTSPQGTTVRLENVGSGSVPGDATVSVWPLAVEPHEDLSAFHGQDAQGTWTLSIEDTQVNSLGTLDEWSLHFDCQ